MIGENKLRGGPGVPVVPVSPGSAGAAGRRHQVSQVPHQRRMDNSSLHGSETVNYELVLLHYLYSIKYSWKSLLTIMLSGPQCLWMNSQWSTFCLRTKQQPAPAWPKHDSLSIAMISPSLTSKKKAPGPGKSNPRRVLDLMRTITRERRDPVVHNLSAGSTTCDLCHDNTAS